MSTRRAEEVETIARAQRGDRAALAALFAAYQRRVFSVAYGMVGNRDDAMDITQEVFLTAFRTLGEFAGKAALSTWLYRITVNKSIDFHRQQRTRGQRRFVSIDGAHPPEGVERSLELGLGDASRAQPPIHPTAQAEQRQVGARLAAALGELPEIHRAVLLLREVEGLSYQKLAETLHISIGTVMSRLFHARRKMKALLKDREASDPPIAEQPSASQRPSTPPPRLEREPARAAERRIALPTLRGPREVH